MNRRNFVTTGLSLAALALFTTGCTTTSGNPGDPAMQRNAIDSAIDSALSRLYQEAPGSAEIVASAKGVLVFPAVISAGFIVGGAQGQGALRRGGKTTGYFRMTEASVGLQAGTGSQAVFILFMTQDALDRFEASRGWTAGVDGSLSLLTVGANARVTTQTGQQPIVGFVLTNSGLRANVSLNGNRITPLDL
jgi:lipid-binding SYLF domain-containing protein